MSDKGKRQVDHATLEMDLSGNAAAARQYLAWETGRVDQLDAQERGVFRVAPPSISA